MFTACGMYRLYSPYRLHEEVHSVLFSRRIGLLFIVLYGIYGHYHISQYKPLLLIEPVFQLYGVFASFSAFSSYLHVYVALKLCLSIIKCLFDLYLIIHGMQGRLFVFKM